MYPVRGLDKQEVEAKHEQSEEMEGKKEEREAKETERKRRPTRMGGIKKRKQGREGKAPFIISSNVHDMLSYDMIYTQSENHPSPNSPQTKVKKGR